MIKQNVTYGSPKNNETYADSQRSRVTDGLEMLSRIKTEKKSQSRNFDSATIKECLDALEKIAKTSHPMNPEDLTT